MKPKGVKQHFEYQLPTGEICEIDDAAISSDAPEWWQGNRIKRQGYLREEKKAQAQQQVKNNFLVHYVLP